MGKRNWKKWLAVLLCMAMCMGNAGAVRVYAAVTDGETGKETSEQEEEKVPEEEEEKKEPGTSKDDEAETPGEEKPGTTGEEKPGTSGEEKPGSPEEEKPEIPKDDEGEKPGMPGENIPGTPEEGETETDGEISDESDENLSEDTILSINEEMVDDEVSEMALETSGSCGANVTWRFEDGVLTISGSGAMYDYDSPYGENAPWYNHSNNIKRVVVEEGVTTIGECAFFTCHSTSIELPSSVTTIGNAAFWSCVYLTSIELPSSVTTIGEYAFHGCDYLTSIELPSGITTIGEYAFQYCCNLTSIKLPSGVTTIERGVFDDCRKLTSIELPSSVTAIGESAFEYCVSLTSIKLPSGITTIERKAFYACSNLTGIEIPLGVTTIGWGAFGGCSSLTDVYYGGSESDWRAITVGDGNEPLTSAIIHYNSTGPDDENNNRKTIGGTLRSGEGCTVRWACRYLPDEDGIPHDGRVDITVDGSDSKNEELYLYNESIDSGLPFPWELEPYNIPKSAISTFYVEGTQAKKLRITADSLKDYTGLETVVLSHVTGIDSNAFNGCTSLKSFGFLYGEADLTVIDNGAFANCSSLKEMTFPSGLARIGDGAFRNTAFGIITLGENITEIGDSAFSDCPDILIRCFKDSAAHKHAQKYNIPFQLITEDAVSIYCGGGSVESFSNDLDYYVTTTSSDTYNPQLSHMLIAMSCAAYNVDDVKKSYKELGFKDNDIHCDYSTGGVDPISYAIGKKTMSNGKTLVLVTIRGTTTDYEWLSNVQLGGSVLGCFWHAGFESAANAVYDSLYDFLQGNLSDTTFVITGHSRGAAAANLLEVKLFNAKVKNKDVYGYNFACPDVATGLPTGWNWLGEHNNIFNIGNAPDPVSVVPGALGSVFLSKIPGTSWGKFGQSRWFSRDWGNLSETELDLSFSAHGQEVYLNYLRKEPAFATFKTWEEKKTAILASDIKTVGRLLGFCCPVDVTITDKVGNSVASVVDGVPNYYGSSFGEIIIFTDGDKKAIFVKGDEPLAVHLTATGNGTMEYTAQRINADIQEIITEKTFTNVALTSGKQFISGAKEEDNIAVGTDMKKVDLYVLGDNGKPEKEVLADGNGTEIPIKDDDDPGNKPGTDPGNKPGDKPSSKPNGGSSNGGGGGASDSKASASTLYDRNASGKTVVEAWKPQTPDEKKRYACMGTEPVQYTLAKDNAYRIVIENAMQGPLCFASFESALAGYTIARTYNIYTLPNNVYSREQEVQFTLTIPEAVYKEGRNYKMICVTKNGVPVIYDDLDDDPRTITVRTNKFYAYALIYK